MSVGILVDRDTSWAERWAVTTVFFGSGLGIGAWAASVPTFKDRFGLSDGALSIALLAFAAGAVVSMPLTGLLGPKFGAARLIRLTSLLLRRHAALAAPGLEPAHPGRGRLRDGSWAGIARRRHERLCQWCGTALESPHHVLLPRCLERRRAVGRRARSRARWFLTGDGGGDGDRDDPHSWGLDGVS